MAGLIVASEEPSARPRPFVKLQGSGTPPAVHVDDVAVGRLATACLLDLGHRRVAHIRGPHISPANLRYRGYLEALRARGMAAREDYMAAGRFDIESGREAMRKLIALAPRPTAVFAGNDPMAIGAFYACKEAGLAVPADISIVGAGNIEGAHHPNPFLTTVDWPRVELGRAAAGALCGQHRAAWMERARFGVMNHFLAEWIAPEAHRGVEEWNRLVDAFDAEGLSAQVASTGAGYHLLTLGQNSGFYISPNAAHDRLTGIRRFQFRWEMYNAFNHTQFNGVDTSARFDAAGKMVNTRFGQITGARAPCTQQLALRLSF